MAPIWFVEISKLPRSWRRATNWKNRWALRDREMRVADAGRAEDQDVFRLREKSAGRQLADQALTSSCLSLEPPVAPSRQMRAAIDRGYERASLDRNPEFVVVRAGDVGGWPPRIRLARRHRVTTRPIPIDSSISTKPVIFRSNTLPTEEPAPTDHDGRLYDASAWPVSAVSSI
jgi:hypothetical protein